MKSIASAWRMAGSPRVPGFPAAWRALQGVSRVFRALPGPFKVSVLVAVTAGSLSLALALGARLPTPRQSGDSTRIPTVIAVRYLTEVDAVKLAVAAALEKGLNSEGFAHIARRVTLGEYADAIGEGFRARQGQYEAPANTEVWVVAFSGEVSLEIEGTGPLVYDNLTLVLDALNGQVYRVEAFYGDFESPARAPVWLRAQSGAPQSDHTAPGGR